jgi:hypothetical protein
MRTAWLGFFVLVLTASAAAAPVTVPFVGCPSDGQSGPLPVPKAKQVPVSLPPAVAARVAIYGADYSIGVLAPRGWHCAHLYGSNGAFTVVAQEPVSPKALLDHHSIHGPAVQVSMNNGGTSGRFEVARLIARYFPDRHAFLESVIAEEIEPAKDFPRGPFKDDQFVSRRRDFVEVVTPPGRKGLGTESRLDPSDRPIHAAASILGGTDDDWVGYVFAVRLPKDQEDLAPAILTWTEHTYLAPKAR